MSSKDDNDDYRLSKPPAFDNEDFGIPDRHIERVPYDVAALGNLGKKTSQMGVEPTTFCLRGKRMLFGLFC